MALKIRLTRQGAKKRPHYRIIVAESTAPRDGKFIEILGTYDPNQDPLKFEIKPDRLGEWLKKGAKPTPSVASLIRSQGISI